MNYNVIATLGPATTGSAWINRLRDAGADRFRLNTSHIDLDDLDSLLDIFAATRETGRAYNADELNLVLDLQGAKWRIGTTESRELHRDEILHLVPNSEGGSAGVTGVTAAMAGAGAKVTTISVPHTDFFRAATELCASSTGAMKQLRLNDARVELGILSADHNSVLARVVRGGPVASRKGISIVDSDYRHETLSDKDAEIIRRYSRLPWIQFAFSYVRDAIEFRTMRAQLSEHIVEATDTHIRCIAKIERREAVADLERIASEADEIWVCRGDLGAEIGLRAMAEAVFHTARMIPGLRVPLILAGQVLEHMTQHSEATRSEISHMYEALRAGYSGFVLSDETAMGLNPAAACETAAMFRVVQ